MKKVILIFLLLYSIIKIQAQVIGVEIISDIIKSIPSHVEMNFLFKDLGYAYDKNILIEKENTKQSDFQNALYLGMYSTDLNYINIYQQKEDALVCLETLIAKLEDLSVNEIFEVPQVERLIQGNNLDSLLMLITIHLENVQEYFHQGGETYLSITILTGSWLESLYLACKVAQKTNINQQLLYSRIAEQNIVLDQLLLLLSLYKKENSSIKKLRKDLKKIKKIYENHTKSEYSYTSVDISEEVLDPMIRKIVKIRNKIY